MERKQFTTGSRICGIRDKKFGGMIHPCPAGQRLSLEGHKRLLTREAVSSHLAGLR
jgi:hypothetical protein